MDVKFNLRLPEQLYADLADESDYSRASRNAVVIAALRSYLPFVRSRRPRVVQVPVPSSEVRSPVAASRPVLQKPGSVNSPCPCGSGRKWKHCHGKG